MLRHLVTPVGILVMLNGFTAGSAFADAHQQRPVGTWKVLVTYTSGPDIGQHTVTIITFCPDGTLTETTTGPAGTGNGSGTWQSTGSADHTIGVTSFHSAFREPVASGGFVSVQQTAVLSPDGEYYTSSGSGELFLNRQIVATGTTTTSARRQHNT